VLFLCLLIRTLIVNSSSTVIYLKVEITQKILILIDGISFFLVKLL